MSRKNASKKTERCDLKGLPLFEYAVARVKEDLAANCVVICLPEKKSANKRAAEKRIIQAILNHAESLKW